MKIGIIGAGRWGCTLANLIRMGGHEVTLFCLQQDIDRLIVNRQIPCTVFNLDDNVVVTTEALPLLPDCEIVFIAVNGDNLATCKIQWMPYVTGTLVIAVKTISAFEGRLLLPTELIGYRKTTYFASGAFPDGLLSGSEAIGTVYGPKILGREVRSVFPQKVLRIYTSDDLVGGQIVHALKNVIALASGIAVGLGKDAGTVGAIFTRGFAEIERFSNLNRSMIETLAPGSSGLADLYCTCTSPQSHNRQAGIMIAHGDISSDEVEESIGTVEGIRTVSKLRQIPGALDLMPIASAVGKVLFGGITPEEALADLMARPLP